MFRVETCFFEQNFLKRNIFLLSLKTCWWWAGLTWTKSDFFCIFKGQKRHSLQARKECFLFSLVHCVKGMKSTRKCKPWMLCDIIMCFDAWRFFKFLLWRGLDAWSFWLVVCSGFMEEVSFLGILERKSSFFCVQLLIWCKNVYKWLPHPYIFYKVIWWIVLQPGILKQPNSMSNPWFMVWMSCLMTWYMWICRRQDTHTINHGFDIVFGCFKMPGCSTIHQITL